APLPHRRKTPEPCRPPRQDRPLENRGAFAPTAAVGQPRSPSQTNASLAEAARPSNRHRRQPPRCPPRVPSLEAFGRRPSVPAVRLRMGRHPKPFTRAVLHGGLCRPRLIASFVTAAMKN